jgi:hypothetical protein
MLTVDMVVRFSGYDDVELLIAGPQKLRCEGRQRDCGVVNKDNDALPELGFKRHGIPPERTNGSDGVREQGGRREILF